MNPSTAERSKTSLRTWKPHAPLPVLPFRLGHLRLDYRLLRYLLWSLCHGHGYGARTAVQSLAAAGWLGFRELTGGAKLVECNICGWSGSLFYPNCGSGYYEKNHICPRCSCVARYRSLAALLDMETEFFSPNKSVLEAAPVRTFQAYCLWRKQGTNYLSFDLERFGMEKGDITALRYADNSFDYFLCFHVLEHVMADVKAIREIFRVLRPGGQAILQVPIDYSLADTVEYGKPNPFETGHVRRYSDSGFARRLAEAGFAVRKVSVKEICSQADIERYVFDCEPFYFAAKPA
jgi:SAM-dependent methyltransferase